MLWASLLLAGLASARPGGRHNPSQPDQPAEPLAAGYSYDYCWGFYPTNTSCPITQGTFDQWIDHDNKDMGTFKQRYWVNEDYYAGPGSPVILHGPNESAADRQIWYCTNQTGDGWMAQELGAAAIVIEHRYYGDSTPYQEMTTKNLRYLTLDQSMRDLNNFARNVKLPFDKDGSTHPDKAPWIYSGGSYPGALATWIQSVYPGTFWAYKATSAVVQPIADYWQYYVPVEKAMPRNCSSDVKAAMSLLDKKIRLARTDEAKDKIKARFGLAGLKDDDFGWAIIDAMQQWQGTSFYMDYKDNDLYNMCDWVEGVPHRNKAGKPLPDEKGVGACKALKGLAQWLREEHIPGSCKDDGYWSDPNSIACWDLHNTSSPLYTDKSPRNKWGIQWQWFSCNEPFQQWQASAPGDTGLIPRFLSMQDLRDQCDRFFPEEDGYTFGLRSGRTTEQINELTGGWHYTNTTRLMYVNGEYDPWIMETMSSPIRPGGPLPSTEQVPIWVVPKAAHVPDLVSANIRANAYLTKAFGEILATMKKWVDEFEPKDHKDKDDHKN